MTRIDAVAVLVTMQEELVAPINHDLCHATLDLALLDLGITEDELTQARQAGAYCAGMSPAFPPMPTVATVTVDECGSCGEDVPMGEQMYRVHQSWRMGVTDYCRACGERAQAKWWAVFHNQSAQWRADLTEEAFR